MRSYRRKYPERIKQSKNNWRQKNKEYIKKHRRKYYLKNRQKLIKDSIRWAKENPIKARKFSHNWREKNKEKYIINQKKWREENGKEYRKERRKNPRYQLDSNIASAISNALKGNKRRRKWQELVGYSLEDLMGHLEKQFNDKMTWNNYGFYWQVDHKKQMNLFHYENPEEEEFKRCWALDNLRPLEAKENLRRKKSL